MTPDDYIKNKLRDIQKDENIKILYACESGSRMWGFPSKDSDYDVRFIYIHNNDWYLSVERGRDVIELPPDDLYDINGWDLTKFLLLLRKSNPSLLEWLNSNIIYIKDDQFFKKIIELKVKAFNPKVCMQHYLHMANNNYKAYLQGNEIKQKKYFYTLRPILACKWIIERKTFPPVEFRELLSQISDKNIINEIENLLIKKAQGAELDKLPPIETLQKFITNNLIYYKQEISKLSDGHYISLEELNNLFLEILTQTT